MRKAEKILEMYRMDVQETTEQCIRKILRSIRDEISLSIGDIEELLIEDGGVVIHSRAMTEEALCEHIAEQLVVLKDLFNIKEKVLND